MKKLNHGIPCLISLVLIISAIPSDAQTEAGAEIPDLIRQLDVKSESWSASVKLQKLGGAAIAALISDLRTNPDPTNSHTLAALEKMGPPAIPYIVDAFLSCPDEPNRSQNKDRVSFKTMLIKALASMGFSAIPGLVRIAEACPSNQYYGRLYHAYVFQAILGDGPHLSPVQRLPYQSNDPWKKISPASREIVQRKEAAQPFLLRIQDLMIDDHKYWQPQNIAPETDAAFILASWGKGKLKQSGIDMLHQMANTGGEPWYYHADVIRKLISLGTRSASTLLKSNLPPSDYDLRDQVLVSTAKQLFRIGDPGFFDVIVPAFSSKDLAAQRDAIAFSAQAHDLRFVPILISQLNNRTSTGVGSVGENAHDQVVGDLALRALQNLTFAALPMNPNGWEAWWNEKRGTTWSQLLRAYFASCMESFDRTPVWQLNAWITQLRGVYDPTILPLLARYIRHPRLDTHLLDASGLRSYGSNGIVGIGGYGTYDPFPWGSPPEIVNILAGMAEQGNKDAIRLLDSCLSSHDPDVRIYGALALTRFNPGTTINALRQEATREQFVGDALEALVKLGDDSAIGILIEKLASNKLNGLESSRKQGYRLLLKYTQANIPYDLTMTHWRNWWKEHHGNFKSHLMQAEIDDQFNFDVLVSSGMQ